MLEQCHPSSAGNFKCSWVYFLSKMWEQVIVWGSCFYIMVSGAFFDGFGSTFLFSLQGRADSTPSCISHYKEWESLVIMSFLTITRQLSPSVEDRDFPCLRKPGVRKGCDLWGTPQAGMSPGLQAGGDPRSGRHFGLFSAFMAEMLIFSKDKAT